MKMKNKIRTYNDGFIYIHKEIPVKTDFSAKKNIKDTDNLSFIVKLAFKECSKREQDLDFAEASDRTLNLKVKTRLFKGINSEHKVILNNTLYDIIYIDEDRLNREMYFYLERVKVINVE